jgi:hypothetical protein
MCLTKPRLIYNGKSINNYYTNLYDVENKSIIMYRYITYTYIILYYVYYQYKYTSN